MPCDYQALPHLGIQTLAPYIPGKSIEALAQEQGLTNIIKLASNENPYGCSALVTKALSSLTPNQLATYCTSQQHPLLEKIAQKLQVSKDMVVLANGSDTIFSLLLTCFALHQDKFVLTHDHAFISFPIQAKTLGIALKSVPVREDFQVDIDALIQACTQQTALIYIANPNNPTGNLIPKKQLKYLLDNIPSSTILVLDEAYYEYILDPLTPRGPTTSSRDQAARGGQIRFQQTLENSFVGELAHYPNLVITHTFSKVYGLAGLRLGYAVGNGAIISLLHRIQLPFIVNYATLCAGFAALEDDDFIQMTVENNQKGLRQLMNGLTDLHIPYLASSGNFVTFNCQKDALPIYLALQQQGIIVRPLHAYGLGNYLRVSIGSEQQISRFLDTLPICMTAKGTHS